MGLLILNILHGYNGMNLVIIQFKQNMLFNCDLIVTWNSTTGKCRSDTPDS